MTLKEFSNQFDVLVASYRRFRDFDNREPIDTIEFDEFEKSLFLTKAQEELVLSLYNGRNSLLQSFEESEMLRRFLANLIEEAQLSPISTISGRPLGIDSKSKFFTLPHDLWFITYEAAGISDSACGNITSIEVVPAKQDEYHRLRKNPFRGVNNRRCLRFDLGDDNVEVVSKYNVTSYYIRYLKKLQPIVLVDMPDGLTVDGIGAATDCALHSSLHQRILELAVQRALQSKGVNIKNENK